jgi:hypothetical protein
MLMIGTPCYNGMVTINYMLAMMQLKDVLNRERVTFKLLTPAHESLITRARNYIANEFLRQEQCTHLLFIDADVVFPPLLVPRMLAADKDVVCGVYPVKGLRLDRIMAQPSGTPPAVAEAASLDYAVKFAPGSQADASGLVEVEYAATGFMLIKRQVLTRMAEAMPQLRYRYAYVNDASEENYAFFDTAIDPETLDYLPEDYAFCKRWRDLGGRIYASLLGQLSHVGSRVYAGEFAMYLAKRGTRDKS